MSIEVLYLISFLLPLVLMPLVLPAIVLVAHRKRITDSPSDRKHQEKPVAVMGGTVIMLVIGITSVVVNLFYDITPLFPVVCVMFMLYIFGLIDDTIGLDWKVKLLLQFLSITLLFFGSNYGVKVVDFFGFGVLPTWPSYLLTVFCGLMVFNAVNFADGIDGLASAIGVLTGLIIGYWHMRHGFETQAILSVIMMGVMMAFFIFNVFSKRYKSYMGDSGSLVLGLFIYIIVCDDNKDMLDGSFLADNYAFSFCIAVLSYILFDIVRVVVLRVLRHKTPYEGDRSHLHHVYVDMGMSHFLATNVILLSNIIVIAIWYLTASMGLSVWLQLLMTFVAGAVFIWLPYFIIEHYRTKQETKYIAMCDTCKRISLHVDKFVGFMKSVIDGRPAKKKTAVKR